mmetsp:Transcript_14511/g.30036  ORF Transcript_14511/g.30036 Transcript_14511/m.30036 type:complete len:96 (-) Transcript_14511:421-708(-)
MGCGASAGQAAEQQAPVKKGLTRSGSKKGDALMPSGGVKPADREEVRQNALAAAERRAEEQQMRGVQANKPTISPAKEGGNGNNEVVYSDAKTWN